MIVSSASNEVEYGFMLKEEGSCYNIIIFPGAVMRSDDACFKVSVNKTSNHVQIVALPSCTGMKCYKLSLWNSKATLEKVSHKIVETFNSCGGCKIGGVKMMRGSLIRSEANQLQISLD